MQYEDSSTGHQNPKNVQTHPPPLKVDKIMKTRKYNNRGTNPHPLTHSILQKKTHELCKLGMNCRKPK